MHFTEISVGVVPKSKTEFSVLKGWTMILFSKITLLCDKPTVVPHWSCNIFEMKWVPLKAMLQFGSNHVIDDVECIRLLGRNTSMFSALHAMSERSTVTILSGKRKTVNYIRIIHKNLKYHFSTIKVC